MKLIIVALSLLMAAPASADKPIISKDLDGFVKQTEAAKHFTAELVYESQLRGSSDSSESSESSDSSDSSDEDDSDLVAADKQNRNNGARRSEWLKFHNQYRKEWHDKEGYTYKPMKWSNDLFVDAVTLANEITKTCQTKNPSGKPQVDYGWNIAGKHGDPNFRSVEDTFDLWNSILYQGWPKNKEMSQVLWRSTEYVGCADAVSPSDGKKTCTYSVCFYARAGNCGMASVKNWNDHSKKIMTSPGCGPCPGGGEDCPKKP